MSITGVKDNIVNLLENIIKRSEIIERQTGSRNLLEIDIVMEDIRFLYREMERLKVLTEDEIANGSGGASLAGTKRDSKQFPQHRTETPKPASPVMREPAVVQQPTTQPVREEPVPLPVSPPVQKEEPVAPIKKVAETEVPVQPVPPVETPRPNDQKRAAEEVVHTKQPEKPAETTSKSKPAAANKDAMLVGESFKSSENSLHERLARIKDDSSIGARLQQKPITNLKDAIGLNEKFLFINELFGGDINAYNDSISQLNNSPSIHEAFELLNSLTTRFQWDGQRSADTIEKFANLVQRRHMG